MNTLNRKMLPTIITAGLLLGTSGAAVAGDPGQRLATGVGSAIAAQGNAALEQIRVDLRQRLEQTLQPLTPGPQGLADAPGADPTERAA